MTQANFNLKEEIRDDWSKRSESFDLTFRHRIPRGPEFDAWQKGFVANFSADLPPV